MRTKPMASRCTGARPHHPYSRIISAAAIVAVLGLPVLGCGKLQRVRECQEVVATVNGTLDTIEALYDKDRTNPLTYRKIADEYDRLANELNKLELAGREPVQELRTYGGLARRSASATRSLALALEKKNSAATDTAKSTLERLSHEQKQISSRIQAFCART